MAFEAHPVTKERWPDLVELFDRPIVRTCFCMFYRKTGTGTGVGLENPAEAHPASGAQGASARKLCYGTVSPRSRAALSCECRERVHLM